jgi:hypothetical protein
VPNENEVLERRALNRALLQRQHLLSRIDAPVADTLEHLVGLQAQSPLLPYYGLWSRLNRFDPHELGRLLRDRKAVRLSLFRWTVHLVTAEDALRLRPLLQPVIERAFGARRRVSGSTLRRLVTATRELLADRPLTERELGKELVARGLGEDPEQTGRSARVYVPLVQVPPRGVWGERGQAKYATLEAWTGRELEPESSAEALVLRYLGAFGPATVADMQRWSGLTKLRTAFEALRPRLVTFRDEDGKELFDLPDAPRPGPDVAAPVRFLAEYDNVLLGHADRRRIIPEDFPWRTILDQGHFVSNVLVDGMLRAMWRIERDGKRATLLVRPTRLTRAQREEVGAEAERMVELAAGEAEQRVVRFERPL